MARLRMSLARMVRLDLLRWLAAIGWLVWRALEMMHHAMPRGCYPAEPYEHNLDPTCTLHLDKCVHIDPATTIH
jgi:hypothetical protein